MKFKNYADYRKLPELSSGWIKAFLRISPIKAVSEWTGVGWDAVKAIHKELQEVLR